MADCCITVVETLFVVIILLLSLSVESTLRQVKATKLWESGKKPSALPDFTETVKSLTQCVILCNNKEDDCKSIGYQNNQCFIFKELHPESNFEYAEDYKYFEPTPVVAITTTVFKYFSESATFEKASEKCKELGTNGRLACIHDEETYKKIVDIMKKTPTKGDIWIGLRANSTDGPFYWSDGVAISPEKKGYWHNWLYKDPDNYNEDVNFACVRMLSSGENFSKWADHKCKDKHSFMCEIRHI